MAEKPGVVAASTQEVARHLAATAAICEGIAKQRLAAANEKAQDESTKDGIADLLAGLGGRALDRVTMRERGERIYMIDQWMTAGLGMETAKRLTRCRIDDGDDLRKAGQAIAAVCGRARAGFARADRLLASSVIVKGTLLIDAMDTKDASSEECDCGRCEGIEAAIADLPDREVDGWPHKSASDVIDALMAAFGTDAARHARPAVRRR